jgi:hypothetical protein
MIDKMDFSSFFIEEIQQGRSEEGRIGFPKG